MLVKRKRKLERGVLKTYYQVIGAKKAGKDILKISQPELDGEGVTYLTKEQLTFLAHNWTMWF